MTINQQLLAQRRQKHWSQKRAADACGVDLQTYYRWEKGIQIPHGFNLDRLCETFEVPMEELGYAPEAQTEEESNVPTQQANDLLPFTGDNTMENTKSSLLRMMFTGAPEGDQKRWKPSTITRRRALETIIGTAAATIGLSQQQTWIFHPQEILLICGSNIPLCWQLYFEGGLSETKEHLTPYLAQLSTLISTTYQKQAAPLASQAYQLSALVEVLFHNLGTALDHAKRAIEFAHLTDDPNLLTAAYIRLAVVLSNLPHRPHQRLAAYEQALQHAPRTSPLLQARVYAGLMETQSALGNQKDAFHWLDLTNQTVPTQYETDPNFSSTHFDAWSIHMYEKDMYVHLKQPKDAWKILEKSHLIVEQALTVNRVDLTVKQAEISLLLGNLEQTRAYFLLAAEGTAALGSQLLAEDMQKIYMAMKQRWPKEQHILQLEEIMQF